ncbi:MAG: Gfo/Idh/MocA family oxidoreductase [Chitinophagales bacterium]|nr:Gfo/Idh/MocA family oxidoreductase [Chitinophagales bacterium]
MSKKIKIGLLGVGHLGKIHAKLLKEISGFELVGFFDPDNAAAASAENLALKRFENLDALLAESAAIDIVCNTSAHFEMAVKAAKQGKHFFVEKPVTKTVEEAKKLLKIVEEAGVKAMVGHVERFNPALLSLDSSKIKPVFIEVHRLAQFNPRGTDVSVIHDLMIHDLDIILSLVKSKVYRVYASGVAIVSASPDIANARIEFENGCVANVTASRISMKNMRKMRIFQKNAYLGVDFLKGNTDVLKMHQRKPSSDIPAFEIDLAEGKKFISMQSFTKQDVNAIKLELEFFHKSITQNKPSPISIEDGYRALQLAQQVANAVEKHIKEVKI